jgi:hypothetical protein
MAGLDPRQEIVRDLLRHPRVVHQGLFANAADREKLVDVIPAFTPFRGDGYAFVTWVLDWDHRLPSKELVLRLYVYYTAEARERGRRERQDRETEIAREDLFPEFDVPDFAGVFADEAYEAELSLEGVPTKFRRVSEWRRQIEPRLGSQAETIVRKSTEFRELASKLPLRSQGLGDLEAAEWAPPSESGHSRWGIDVWYLRSFNGMVGEGTAFLVDVQDARVVSQRDFQFRAG